MGTVTYNRDIPYAPNDPSNDQPKMKQNTNGTYDILNVDHYTFGSASSNDGRHKQVQLPVLGAIPGGLQAGEGTLYTKTSVESEVFYTPDLTGNEYQITRTITANFAQFGTNLAYIPAPPAGHTQVGGWTFLPGGLFFQYGTYTTAGPSGTFTVQFPTPFTSSLYNLTAIVTSAAIPFLPTITAKTTTSFSFISSIGVEIVSWTAIGK